jgi:suppressor of fused
MSWWKRKAPSTPPAPERPAPTDELSAALDARYPGQPPFHLGAAIRFADGGPDPIDGVSIYWHERGPHWHYVSHGLAASLGLEFTFRLAARPTDRGTEPARFLGAIAYQAPTWPVKLLNLLARRVHRTGRPFDHGHWWEGAPGVLRPYTELHFLAFARDPELGTVTSAAGPRTFLQAVGITAETAAAMADDQRSGRGDATLDALSAADPLLVTRA